jgi:hypothetical protein
MARSWLIRVVPPLVAMMLVLGCGTRTPDDDEPIVPKRVSKGKGEGTKSNLVALKGTSYDGVLRGKVQWAGDRPDFAALTRELLETIKQDRDYCLKGKEYETTQQAYRVGKNGNLGNVFVWIEPAEPNQYFEIPDEQLKAVANSEVAINQPHCAFLPHAVNVFLYHFKDGKEQPTGQKLRVNNDASIPHNAKITGTRNPESNDQIPAGSKIYRVLRPESEVITISCGVHPWMRGYIRSHSHPYAAISRVGMNAEKAIYEDPDAADFGTFEIRNLPVGVKVKFKAWHEALGMLKEIELTTAKEQTVDVEARKR